MLDVVLVVVKCGHWGLLPGRIGVRAARSQRKSCSPYIQTTRLSRCSQIRRGSTRRPIWAGWASRSRYCLEGEWQVGKLEPSRNRALEGVYRLWGSPCLFSHVARMEPWRLQKLYSPGAQSDNLGCG